MRESQFQRGLIKEIKDRWPGSIVMKNDSAYIQGIPDLTILYRDRWATLEVKQSEKAHHQPNQDYYVQRMNTMSYSAFIYPENRERILNELEQAFKSGGSARISECEQERLAEEERRRAYRGL